MSQQVPLWVDIDSVSIKHEDFFPIFETKSFYSELISIKNIKFGKSADLKPTIKTIERICASLPSSKKESETCTNVIEPLLALLGYKVDEKNIFDQQRAFSLDGSVYFPDYSIFSSEKNQVSANEHEGLAYYREVEIVLEAKRTGVELARKTKINAKLDDLQRDSLESKAPISQLATYLRLSGVDRGIVTNGNDWILLKGNSRSEFSYFHVRLSDLLKQSNEIDPDAILFWLIPFGKEFLGKSDGDQASVFQSRYENQSNALEGDLKTRLSDVLVESLNAIKTVRKKDKVEANKEDFVKETIAFIYSIFFIACLEDRKLLPITNPIYKRRFSLDHVFSLSQNEFPKTNTFVIYEALTELVKQVCIGCRGLTDEDYGEYSSGDLRIPNALKLPDYLLAPIVKGLLRSKENESSRSSFDLLDTVQFGNIYEHILRVEITYDDESDSFLLERDSPSSPEKSTAVFTPPHIVRKMVSGIVSQLSVQTWDDLSKLKIVDCCFGSGHFMIEFARQLAQKVVDTIPREEWGIGASKSDNAAADRQLLLRFIFGNCIYGVDRAPSCIDVAKYAIWLATVMRGGGPLFLEHQLKSGNSLYGNIVKGRLNPNSPQKKILDIRKAARKNIIGNLQRPNVGKQKELKDKEDAVRKEIPANEWDQLAGLNYFDAKFRELVRERHRAFAWSIEFPEVFAEGGFDVMITNPPYDQLKSSPSTPTWIQAEHFNFRLSKMTDFDIEAFKILFESDPTYAPYQSGYKNLYEAFLLLRNKICSDNAHYSLIVPNSVLASEQTALLRGNLLQGEIKEVIEYPEKDSIKRRVFASRKVACAILTGTTKTQLKGDVPFPISVFNDANSELCTAKGQLTKDSINKLDPADKPIVLISSIQSSLLAGFDKLSLISLSKDLVREGELNEKFSEKSLSSSFAKGLEPIWGTNRICRGYFNSFPKQDSIDYCNMSLATITKSKLADFDKRRIAINGIAGTNDSRVLSSSILPTKTLVNSNVNYICVESLPLGLKPSVVISFINSVVADQLIRIQKRTNHNSSKLIASLPFLRCESDETQELETVKSWVDFSDKDIFAKKNKDGKFPLSGKSYLYLNELSDLITSVGISINGFIDFIADSIWTASNGDINQKYAICRTLLNSDAIDIADILGEVEGGPKKKSEIKTQIVERINHLQALKILMSQLESSLNSFWASVFISDELVKKQLLKTYGVTAKPISLKAAEKQHKEFHEFNSDALSRWAISKVG